jgi:hypothetical protein
MRRIVHLIATVTLAVLVMASPPAHAQGNQPPQAWLFGAWTGGLFPPPSNLGSQECLAQPVVIFTRDIIMRAVITDTAYVQRSVETARITADGVEFRFSPSIAQAPSTPFGLSGNATSETGFGCISPDALQVQRRSDNEISFPGCADFPYPLVRCPSR